MESKIIKQALNEIKEMDCKLTLSNNPIEKISLIHVIKENSAALYELKNTISHLCEILKDGWE